MQARESSDSHIALPLLVSHVFRESYCNTGPILEKNPRSSAIDTAACIKRYQMNVTVDNFSCLQHATDVALVRD